MVKSLNRSQKLIRELELKPLEGESGYFSQIATSNIVVEQDGVKLKANSSIYYLLNRNCPINYLHWLAPDDTHILIDGGPVNYYEFFEQDGKYSSIQHLVGRDILKGERPVLMIPGGHWKALVLPVHVEYALMATQLTPQWTRDRVKVGAGDGFLENYQSTSDWATEKFLRKLIGPNYQAETFGS